MICRRRKGIGEIQEVSWECGCANQKGNLVLRKLRVDLKASHDWHDIVVHNAAHPIGRDTRKNLPGLPRRLDCSRRGISIDSHSFRGPDQGQESCARRKHERGAPGYKFDGDVEADGKVCANHRL